MQQNSIKLQCVKHVTVSLMTSGIHGLAEAFIPTSIQYLSRTFSTLPKWHGWGQSLGDLFDCMMGQTLLVFVVSDLILRRPCFTVSNNDHNSIRTFKYFTQISITILTGVIVVLTTAATLAALAGTTLAITDTIATGVTVGAVVFVAKKIVEFIGRLLKPANDLRLTPGWIT